MLGAAAVLPSVVTLPSGAQSAAQSFSCRNWAARQRDTFGERFGVERFTAAPDEWLRKKVFSGRFAASGRPAYCTTWDQPNILAIAKLETVWERSPTGGPWSSGSGYKALETTTWSDGHDPVRIGGACPPRRLISDPTSCLTESVDNINPEPDHYGLVYVDETGLSCALEPAPGMVPVRATCWASLVGDRGSNLG